MRVKVNDGNDYTKLRDVPVDPGEARRALRQFIARSKQGREIPEELMEFILAGLERQLKNDEGGWFRVEKKIREQDMGAEAWYCLKFDTRFKRSDQLNTRKAQLAAIGQHLKNKWLALFRQFPDIDRSAYKDCFSENLIGNMINEFSCSGFMRPNDTISPEDAHFWNMHEARLICEMRLDMKGDDAEKCAIQILEKWNFEYVEGKK